MRTAGLSLLTGLTALHALTVNGDVFCNTEASLTEPSAISTSGLQGRLLNTISAFCHTPSVKLGTVSEHLDGLILQIHRGEAVQDAEECQAAFTAIISECIETGVASGGRSGVDKGITYVVLPGSPDDHLSNSKRAPAPANAPKPASSQPKPASSQPKPATGNSGAAKPAGGKPAAGNPGAGQPVANTPPKTPAPPAKPIATPKQTKIKIGPTKNCKELAMTMQKPPRGSRVVRSLEEARGGFVGSRVDINSRGEVSKRADEDDEWYEPSEVEIKKNHGGSPKVGSACEITFDALAYPKAASMPPDAPFYSIDTPDGFCENIKFQETKTAVLGERKYHIEHILEWQTVAKFFDWMDRKMAKAGTKFTHPDPTLQNKDQLTFCKYWVEQWKGSYQSQITINGKTMVPLDHMKYAYPGVNNREDEFVWLQSSMNTPAKSNMWSYKGPVKDSMETLYSVEAMHEHITGKKTPIKGQNPEKVAGELVDGAKKALLRLKALLGARKYMRTKKISDILKKQKEEIGKMLDAIDTELPKHPRVPPRGPKKFAPWIKQDLGKHWTEYMDERFEIAEKRTKKDMNTYLKLLDDTWCNGRPKSNPSTPASSRPGTPKSGSRPGTPDSIVNLADLFGAMDLNDVKIKDLCRFRDKVQKEWNTEKAIPWTKPW